jgi:hypothetical protein
MKKRLIVSMSVFLVMVFMAGVVYAASPIKIYIDGKLINSEVPPSITKGKTMVPLRVIAEYFGAEVKWDANTRSVLITSKKNYRAELSLANEIQYQAFLLLEANSIITEAFAEQNYPDALLDGAMQKLSIIEVREQVLTGFKKTSKDTTLNENADNLIYIRKSMVYTASGLKNNLPFGKPGADNEFVSGAITAVYEDLAKIKKISENINIYQAQTVLKF